MGFFDADLFLDDLVACRQEFCSAFLVVSVLGLACVSTFMPAFLQEAEMLWKGEAANDSVLSVAAIEIFSTACILEGNDTLGKELSMAGRLMAERLGLFGTVDGAAAAGLAQKSPEWAMATSHIAWGAIAEEVMGVYLTADGRDVSDRVPLAFAEAKFRKLLEWAASLTAEMKREILAPADLMIFHIWFHVIVTIIFRPFTSTRETDRLMSFTSMDSHPKQIHAASINQLREIILNYQTYAAGSSFTSYINPGVLTVSLALLEDRSDPQWRSYFLLCVRCWRDLYASYPVFRNIVQAFLSMAMQKDAFTAHESKEIMEWVEGNGRHHAKGTESFTTFIFDPTSAAASESQINSMALKFDEMILLDEFTTV
ncbi:C6 transcription factor [Colletotrichum musicola]|uniref:C6 transcription factor n=1 Tax=Colletotrichum musicola TaxID=2175873 RepID=A0A8H6ITW3_9PEZI|nr:C6 transcription factor [Colletotrichum musicola]